MTSPPRHSPRCGICGAPTRPRKLPGAIDGWICVSCGSATLDQRAVALLGQRLPRGAEPAPLSATVPPRQPGPPPPQPPARPVAPTGPTGQGGVAEMSEERFEAQLIALRSRRERRLTLIVAALTGIIVLALALPLSYAIYRGMRGTTAQPAPPPQPTLPQEAPAPAPPAPVPDDGPAEVAVEVPAPAPAPEGRSAEVLVEEGWASVDRSPATAARLFREALDQQPAHPDASYGLGYAYLRQSRPAAAAPHLCTALERGDLEIRRDVQSLLRSNQLECAP